MTTKLRQTFHMKEGTSDTSYAKCSYIPNQVLSSTKYIKEEAMKELYMKQCPRTLCIADLGCSSAEQNTLSVITDLIKVVEMTRVGHEHEQDYQIYLNDLPSNDFNTLFSSVRIFQNELKKRLGVGFGNCFVNGVPGSFYERLFPNNSLHFVHSSYSLHWLSQEPERLGDNERNIFIARTSPPNVCKAYYDQFQKDFTMFLACRSKEVVPSGVMVLTFVGRDTDEAYSKESCYMWEMLASALNDMISDGYIEEEKVKSFHIPIYSPSPSELELLVRKQGCFTLNQVHVSKANWDGMIDDKNHIYDFDPSHDFMRCMRSVAEPLLISHFGEGIIERVFQNYADNVRDCMARENCNFVNVTISLTRNNVE